MRQLLDPSSFSARSFAARENERVFADSWQLVAVQQDVPRAGDTKIVRVADRQWLLRRGQDGALRAFSNVCLHRGARVCTKDGHGPLRCAYHGWSYDDAGALMGVPFRSDFDGESLSGLRLAPARVETWGPAVFLHPASVGPTLSAELGPLYGTLDPLFSAMDQALDRGAIDIDANWKLVMENALETYHVRFIHGESIHPLGFEVTRTDFHGAHSVSQYSAPPSPRKLRAIAFAFPERPLALDGYLHANIFPNSTVATAYGNFFVLTRTEPLDVGKTRLHWYMFSTRCAARTQGASDAAALMDDSNRRFLRATFEEDAAVCTSVHEGCREATSRGYLGAQERRVVAFERELSERVGAFAQPTTTTPERASQEG